MPASRPTSSTGIKKERIKSILDLVHLALQRIRQAAGRTRAHQDARSKSRKVIDRAKGILMKAKGLTEDEAYVLLRTTAMNENKKIAEIAQSIITASEMLK